MIRYPYMEDSVTDKEWDFIFVKAESAAEALEKLKENKNVETMGGDSAHVNEYEFVETII